MAHSTHSTVAPIGTVQPAVTDAPSVTSATPSLASAAEPVFIARQPIFDMVPKVFGYELLFRASSENAYSSTDGCLASSQTISRALHTLGLEAVAGGKKIFVNFPKKLLLEEMYTVLPPEQVVVELLEATAVDDEVIAACKKLKSLGYVLALDDVTDPIAVRPLIPYADIVKVDFLALPTEQRAVLAAELAGHPGKLLAEKVETREDFDQAVALGCAYVQGYFFAKPEIMMGRGPTGLEPVYLEFLQALSRPQLDFVYLEELIKRDLSLAYKLLRYLNSSAIGLRHKVTSIKQALVLIGERPLRKWGTLVAITSLNRKKPVELVLMSLARAHFCEAIAKAQDMPERQLEMFLTGLLSVIDALLDQPMAQVLAQMSVSADLKAVLLADPSAPKDLARIYTLVKACERGAWGTVTQASAGLRRTQAEIAMLYYESIVWADQLMAL